MGRRGIAEEFVREDQTLKRKGKEKTRKREKEGGA